MCGRYAASAGADQLTELFEIDEVVDAPQPQPWTVPHYNLAPTDDVPAVVERRDQQSGETIRKLTGLRWGLVPSWSKDLSGGARLINARLETVDTKPSFRKAFAARRCLLPADGYYEWYTLRDDAGEPLKGKGGRPLKQPFFIHPLTDEPMVMAGLYEFWRNPGSDPGAPDAWVTSCTIITTDATDDLGVIHDRMPVQVQREHWSAWLDPRLTDPGAARDLLHVPEPGEMTAHAVSPLVGTVTNDGPELIAPLVEQGR